MGKREEEQVKKQRRKRIIIASNILGLIYSLFCFILVHIQDVGKMIPDRIIPIANVQIRGIAWDWECGHLRIILRTYDLELDQEMVQVWDRTAGLIYDNRVDWIDGKPTIIQIGVKQWPWRDDSQLKKDSAYWAVLGEEAK